VLIIHIQDSLKKTDGVSPSSMIQIVKNTMVKLPDIQHGYMAEYGRLVVFPLKDTTCVSFSVVPSNGVPCFSNLSVIYLAMPQE
jgi:hypothetical protein